MKDMSEYIRVTDVLYPLSGLRFIDPAVLKNAADRGTKVHNIANALMDGIGVYNEDPNVQGYIDSLSQWLPGKEFVDRPGRFFCDELMITGEVDCLYKEGDGMVLVDLKTPASEGKTWKYQLSAYKYLAQKAGLNIVRIEAVRLSKTGGKPKTYVYEDHLAMYLHCLFVYKEFFWSKEEENPLDYL